MAAQAVAENVKETRYESQVIAYWYFGASVLLFLLQTVFGLVVGAQYLWPDLFFDWMPFNVARSIHINLLIFWLLIGFMGAIYYVIVDETRRKLYSPMLAKLQLGLLLVAGVGAIISYFFGYYGGQGMEYIEAAPIFDWLIVVAAVIFLINSFMTVWRSERGFNVITGVLIAMAAALSLLYFAGMPFFDNLSTQQFWWWWVIHYWVEGTWEVLEVALVAYLLIKLTGVERSRVYKWLYIEAGLVLFTGIIGQGHHYFWIGTPAYWLGLGSIFSALEPIPILLMMLDSLLHVRRRQTEVKNRVALYWLVGGGVMHFLGA
ncbi:MAG: cbb3-type cytochrome c oxidase subunit I, partial [Candidatus Bipolaricaulia bacterium]